MITLDLQLFAHKKGLGSTRNGRDSAAQRLGIKKFGGQYVKPGDIIIRQRGSEFKPGDNVMMGRDYTIFSVTEGRVSFEKRGNKKKLINVEPVAV
ncbi:MAG TPA: 50S ribosomal protein L27 [Candidatus Eremiobacteraeota bacterium]|nr:MAG: 50S ribosomal protein L27 [bacterium ADurb.Bin363]HPZ09617.1 50S ribosomal protein L27 [Candidatus Eremiobacteraeota bacterium]